MFVQNADILQITFLFKNMIMKYKIRLHLQLLILPLTLCSCRKAFEWSYFENALKNDYTYLNASEAAIVAKTLLLDTENISFKNKIVELTKSKIKKDIKYIFDENNNPVLIEDNSYEEGFTHNFDCDLGNFSLSMLYKDKIVDHVNGNTSNSMVLITQDYSFTSDMKNEYFTLNYSGSDKNNNYLEGNFIKVVDSSESSIKSNIAMLKESLLDLSLYVNELEHISNNFYDAKYDVGEVVFYTYLKSELKNIDGKYIKTFCIEFEEISQSVNSESKTYIYTVCDRTFNPINGNYYYRNRMNLTTYYNDGSIRRVDDCEMTMLVINDKKNDLLPLFTNKAELENAKRDFTQTDFSFELLPDLVQEDGIPYSQKLYNEFVK